MLYIDFHTHTSPQEPQVLAVVDGRDTWGIHPWQADEPFVVPDLTGKLAIGECGLDGLRGPSLERQTDVFRRHIQLSEETRLPLIVHCVRALDLLLRLRRELRPKAPWMVHGFRGKPQQLRSLTDAGCYVSFGFRHNPQSLIACPSHLLMLETDTDTAQPVANLYNNVARERATTLEQLAATMAQNYRAFFRKEPFPTENHGGQC